MQFNFPKTFTALICSSLLGGSPVSAEILNLNPIADTALRDGVPNNNFGGAVDLPVGVASAGVPRNRVLLKFDLSAIPANATIRSATLRLAVVQTGTEPAAFGLHRLLQDWGEGDKTTTVTGAAASSGEATWNARFHPSTPWASGGGQAGSDYREVSSAVGTLAGTGSAGTFSSEEMIADLEFWLAEPDANFGWMLLAVNEPPMTGKRIGSREQANPDAKPLLTIDYLAVVPPPQPLVLDPGLVGGEMRFSFHAAANHPYVVEFRNSLTTGAWEVLTSFAEQPSDTTLQVADPLSSGERYYRIRTP